MAFIVPKSLLYSEGWYSAVQSLYRNTSQIIDVEQAFEKVLLEQVVFVYTNATTYTHYRARKFIDNRFLSDNLIPNKVVDGFRAWICDVSMAELSLALKLIHATTFMKDVATSSRGLPIQRSIASEGEYKIIGGKNIGRYKLTGFRGFVHRSEVLRNKRKAGQILGAPKVISQQIVAHIQNPIPHIMITATVDSDGSILGLDTVENTYLTTDTIHLNLVAALFNSKLIN